MYPLLNNLSLIKVAKNNKPCSLLTSQCLLLSFKKYCIFTYFARCMYVSTQSRRPSYRSQFSGWLRPAGSVASIFAHWVFLLLICFHYMYRMYIHVYVYMYIEPKRCHWDYLVCFCSATHTVISVYLFVSLCFHGFTMNQHSLSEELHLVFLLDAN